MIAIFPALLIIAGYIWGEKYFGSKDQFQVWINSAGFAAPFAFFIIQVVQVVVTPVNHYIIGVLGGTMFGLWPGFFLNWSGRTIGSIIAFFIGRKAGRPLVKKFISNEAIGKYDKYASRGGWILFLIYFLPLFPDDEITYFAGISKMPIRIFIPAMLFGHIGGSIGLAYTGAGIKVRDPLFYVIIIITLVCGLVLTILMRRLNKKKKI